MMASLYNAAIILLGVLARGTLAADVTATSGGLSANVLGHSGKITIFNSAIKDSPTVTISFKSINEMDATNSTVTAQGHSYNSFASQDFVFSPLDNSSFKGIAATHFNFSATLTGNNAVFLADVWLMQANGTVTNGDESFALHTGDLKFSLTVSNWAFCAPCNPGNVQGTHLAVVVDVKSSATVPSAAGSPAADGNKHVVKQVGLGSGASLSLSSVVAVDGTSTAADVSVATNGNTATFTVNLPKFTQKAIYDPVVSMQSTSTSTPTSAANGLSVSWTSLFLSAAAVAAKLLM
jgi:hypothetical protein